MRQFVTFPNRFSLPIIRPFCLGAGMRHFRPQPTFIALVLSGLFSQAMAQSVAPVEMPEVVVTDSRIKPNDGAIRSADVLSAAAATGDTASLLRTVPGVQTSGAGGVSSLPVMRGLADDRLRIQVDGMDLISSCANHMNPALSYIDPSNVDSVEVFAGVTPVSVGGDSVGGSIRVKSKAPRFSKSGEGLTSGGQVGGFYRSNGDAWGLNVALDAATESFAISYTGATVEAGNYKAGKDFKAGAVQTTTLTQPYVAGDEVAGSKYKSQNHQLGLAMRSDNHQLELKVGVQEIPYQGFANQRMDMTRNESTQVNLGYVGEFNWGKLEARVYNEKTRHTMNFLEEKRTTAAGMPMDTEGKTSGAQLKADINLSSRDVLRLGAEYQRYRLNDWWDPISAAPGGMMSPDVFWNIRNGERDKVDLFAEWDAKWSPQWSSQLGARFSHVAMDTGTVQGYSSMMYGDPANPASVPGAFNSRDRKRTDNNIDLTAMARYLANANADYEIGYARKNRSPNMYERYTWSTANTMAMNMINWFGDANGYVGNVDLKPEVAHTLSTTGKWHDAAKESWSVNLTPYYTYIENYIDAARCNTGVAPCNLANTTATTGFVYLQFVNQSAEIYGSTLSGSTRLGRLSGLGDFRLNAVLDYTRGKNKTTGDNLYNIMPLNAKLAVEQKLAGWTNTAEGVFVDRKSNVSQTRNEVQTGGYGLLNLRSSKAWGAYRLELGIDNVFNKFYSLPLGGAYIGQRTPAQAWGLPVPGMGRSAYVGFNVKF